VRSFPVWPVIVFYRVDGEFAVVARVIDGRRDLGTAFFAD
jgi:plasmid stabilization system protein ParE